MPEGRRGGQCSLLSVPVQGSWKTCHLSLPPFLQSWENLEEAWQKTTAAAKEEVAYYNRFSKGESISRSEQTAIAPSTSTATP
jgi:hypothetical protein